MKSLRANYSLIKKKYDKVGKKNVRLTQSSLLLALPIDATSNTYRFPVLETDTAVAPLPWEIRLNINDEFIAYDLGYYVVAGKTAARSGETGAIPAHDAGRFFLSYAPDELNTSMADIEDAWLGVLQILVNKISRLEKWDLKKHNFIPRTQFQNSSAGIPQATQPSLDYSDHGMFPMQPMLTLSGAKKNDVVVSLVHSIPTTGMAVWTLPDGGTVTFAATWLSLIFRGMLAQNAAKFQ